MDPYIVVLAGAGLLVLMTAWLPMLLRRIPLSLPIFSVALGAALFLLPGFRGAAPHPLDHNELIERMTEMVVIVALMGCGLKLDRPLHWARSGLTWRLLGVAMPLTILALAVAGYAMLGLGVAAALLLASVLAPTDPVLAADVQVGPPGKGEEDEVRFALTSEAGLNDGLAFPFVNLAIALALATKGGGSWFADWLLVDVVWKLAAGVVVGWLAGRLLGWLTFRAPVNTRLSGTGDGFVALAITFLSYALAEMAHGYGFLAVFVSALTFRSMERGHEYHGHLHDFIEQLERLMMVAVLFLFGASIAGGQLFYAVTWEVVLFTLVAIFVVRPLAGMLAFWGRPESWREKAVMAFFGIRGVGSAYYLAYGIGHAEFDEAGLLWSALGLTMLVSIVLHGVTVTPIMRRLDRDGGRVPRGGS